MAVINIRGVDEALAKAIKAKAIEEGQTLRGWVLSVLAAACRESVAAVAVTERRAHKKEAPDPTEPTRTTPSVIAAGQLRNTDRPGYDHDKYLSLPASDQMRYLREHPRR